MSLIRLDEEILQYFAKRFFCQVKCDVSINLVISHDCSTKKHHTLEIISLLRYLYRSHQSKYPHILKNQQSRVNQNNISSNHKPLLYHDIVDADVTTFNKYFSSLVLLFISNQIKFIWFIIIIIINNNWQREVTSIFQWSVCN